MQYDFDALGFVDYFVEGIGLGDVGHDYNLDSVWVGGANRGGLFLGANSCDDGVALGMELLKDMGCTNVNDGVGLSSVHGFNIPAMKPDPPTSPCLYQLCVWA